MVSRSGRRPVSRVRHEHRYSCMNLSYFSVFSVVPGLHVLRVLGMFVEPHDVTLLLTACKGHRTSRNMSEIIVSDT